MIRVVLDTNVLVSALLVQDGAEATVLARVIEGKLFWCVSEDIVKEYAAVLNRNKFKRIDRLKISAALTLPDSAK